MGFDGNMSMNGGPEAFDLSRLQQSIQVTRQIIDAPIRTEGEPFDLADGVLEINFLVAEEGAFVARTYRVGKDGIASLEAALTEIREAQEAQGA